MKFLQAPLIVVAFTITSSSCQPTSQPGSQCVGTAGKPATSCKEILECNPTAESRYYWVRNAARSAVQVFCEMNTDKCGSITGGWMRAAYIDVTNASNACPPGLKNETRCVDAFCPVRMCTRSHSGYNGCSKVTFPTYGVPYTKVCGMARGYQIGYTRSFFSNYYTGQKDLDDAYVSGLSVTYGNLQKHIWTFAAGMSKNRNYIAMNCPCARNKGLAAPPFVGENYFCESGNPKRVKRKWYYEDPLWDSKHCGKGSTCCDRDGPWFNTKLRQEVKDDIEVRMCLLDQIDNEDIGVDKLEIFIY